MGLRGDHGSQQDCGTRERSQIWGYRQIRVDVPESGGIPKFTKFFNVNAVYAITPLTKEDATDFALKILAKPIDIFDMQTIFQNKIREMVKKGELTEAHTVDNGDGDDDDDDDEF